MLIIMGTSLKVHGLKKLVKEFAKAVNTSTSPSSFPSKKPKKGNLVGKVVFVNKTAPGAEWADVIDYHVGGETDRWVEKVIEDWKRMRPADWEVQKTLDGDGDISMGGFKVVKEIAAQAKGKLNLLMKQRRTTDILPSPKGNGKKRAAGTENVAPLKTLFPSEESPSTKASPLPPLSPSKRRQAVSHYSDVECSPSKKRDTTLAAGVEKLSMEERGLLFADTTNGKPTAGKSNQEVNVRKKRSQKMDVDVIPERKTAGKKKAEMWVEIQVPPIQAR